VTAQLPDEISVTAHGSVRVIRLNRRAQRNAVNAEMHRGLSEVWQVVAADQDARAAVLTGVGSSFCAGGDFAFMQESQDPRGRWRVMEEGRRIITEMLRFPLPLVAAVNGPAVGLGCSLAVLSDIVLIAESAHLADPHVLVGLVAGDGGAAIWPAHTSMLRAKEFLLTGDRISPADAVAMGLANHVVPDAKLEERALALAERLAAAPAGALRDTKRALNMHLEQAMTGPMNFAIAAERYSMADEPHIAFVEQQATRRAQRAKAEDA
jgi:enoyl-CoA hydratase